MTGTVPVDNFLLTGAVLVNNFLLTGTVPVNNSLLTGTVPGNNFLLTGIVLVNNANDSIYSVCKSNIGCKIIDLDFLAALYYQVFFWVFDVLQAEGVFESMISRISNIYQDSLTIPIVGNVLRKATMCWFGVASNPLTEFSIKSLYVPLQTLGPSTLHGSQWIYFALIKS